MRYYLKMVILCAITTASTSLIFAQHENGYEITGKFKGMQDGGWVKMCLFNSKAYHEYAKYMTYPDSAVIKNGEFHLKGVVLDGPRRYFLEIQYAPRKNKTIDLWIANGEKMTISSSVPIDSFEHGSIQHYVDITGSPTFESRLRLEPLREFYFQSLLGVRNLLKVAQDSNGFNPSVIAPLIAMRNRVNFVLYRTMLWPENVDPDRKRANLVFMGEFNPAGHPDFWPKVYNSLTEQEKNSFNGKWLKELVAISVGQPFPEFKLPMPDGKILSSTDVIAKSKITVVQFWSAGASARKKYQEELKLMYKKYHDKGLNVIGVFRDDTNYENMNSYMAVDVKKQYADILKSDNFPWYNVADLDYKNGPVEKIYREGDENDVTNVVIGADGKIIAWDASGGELQYYLWKAFGE